MFYLFLGLISPKPALPTALQNQAHDCWVVWTRHHESNTREPRTEQKASLHCCHCWLSVKKKGLDHTLQNRDEQQCYEQWIGLQQSYAYKSNIFLHN